MLYERLKKYNFRLFARFLFIFVSKLVPIDRKILWEICSTCKLEMEIRRSRGLHSRRTMSPRCHLASANFHEFRKHSDVSKPWESVSRCRFEDTRYRNWKIKSSSVFFFFDLWRGTGRKYGDSQREYLTGISFVEMIGDKARRLPIANAFFPFFFL